MHLQKGTTRRFVFAVGLAGLLAIGTYAFTAGNVVPATKAGDGNNTITGFTVTAVDYTLNAANPQTMDSVAFKLSGNVPSTTNVKIQLDTPAGAWFPSGTDCTVGAYDSVSDTTAVTCATTGATVVSADQLTVVAVD